MENKHKLLTVLISDGVIGEFTFSLNIFTFMIANFFF